MKAPNKKPRTDWLIYPQLLPGANSDAARRKSDLSENSETVCRKSPAALEIQHAVRVEREVGTP